jgi:hypothetical protein
MRGDGMADARRVSFLPRFSLIPARFSAHCTPVGSVLGVGTLSGRPIDAD